MIIKIIIKRKDEKGYFNKFIYEFDHVFPRIGIWGWENGSRVIFNFGEEPKKLCMWPNKILAIPKDGKTIKFVECYKNLNDSEAPYIIAYSGEMYILEKGKIVDKS